MMRSNLTVMDIFTPTSFTLIGATCATLYMLMAYVDLEKD